MLLVGNANPLSAVDVDCSILHIPCWGSLNR